jgi:chromosome segregation ATPase
MIEMSTWVLVSVLEAWLLSSGVLGFLVWKARRRQRRLQLEVDTLQQHWEMLPPASLAASQDQPDDPEIEAADPFAAVFQTSVDLEAATEHFQESMGQEGTDELSRLTQQQALLEATIAELRTANAQLTQEMAAKDALLQERLASAQAEKTRLDEVRETMHQELQQVKTHLARREAEFADVQTQYEDLSSEYRRLFSSLRR